MNVRAILQEEITYSKTIKTEFPSLSAAHRSDTSIEFNVGTMHIKQKTLSYQARG